MKREQTNNVQQIVTHINNKEPSQMKNLVNKEISSRVMGMIRTKRKEVGTTIFGR
jgi:hypothetical protein